MISAGIDIGGTRVKIGLVKGKELFGTSIQRVRHRDSLSKELPFILDGIEALIKEKGSDESLASIGLAIPAIIDSHQNRILSRYVKYTDANDVDFQKIISSRFDVHISIENDAKAALVGEYIFGAGGGEQDLVMVTLGTGIGSAVMMGGELIRGKHFLAGNLAGHMSLDINGNNCNCGDIGCAESLASGWSLPLAYEKLSGRKIDLNIGYKWIFSNKDKDEFAREIWNQSLRTWCHTIKNLIYAYDPAKIILGGGILHLKDAILPVLRNHIQSLAWLNGRVIPVVAAQYPDWSGAFGMAWIASQKCNHAK